MEVWSSLVYGTCLESRRVGNSPVGSNPTTSAKFRIGSAKQNLAGSIPALLTKIRVMCHGGNQTILLFNFNMKGLICQVYS